MPEIMMEIPADEFSADEIPADEFSADEIPADEFLSDEIPAEEKEEPLNVSPESMTETLAPENKDIFSEQQTEMSGSDVKTDLHDDFEVPEASADLFEQNTMYVRTDEPEESPQTEESVPDDRNVLRNEDHSESGNAPEKAQDEHADSVTHEDTDRQTSRSEEGSYRQTGKSGEEQYRQTGMREGEQYRQTGRPEQGPYRRDGGTNEDWRSRASRTNDTNGSFEPEKGRSTGNGGRYSSSYDRYRFENPSDRGPVNTPNPRFPEESKKPSSGKENKKRKRGWIAAGIAAGVLAAAFLLFFGIRAALMSAVNTARSTPELGAQAGA